MQTLTNSSAKTATPTSSHGATMRIQPPTAERSGLMFLYALGGAVLIGIGFFFYATADKKHKATTKFDYTKAIPSDAQLRLRLTQDQYRLTRQNGTEGAYSNAYYNNVRAGIYVDIISGEPLFSSLDKFDGQTGRPSFTKPIAKEHIVEKPEVSQGTERTDVRSHHSDAHLGHLFHDGPPPTGLRYTVNSGALRFIPQEKLEDEGYGDYVALFSKAAK